MATDAGDVVVQGIPGMPGMKLLEPGPGETFTSAEGFIFVCTEGRPLTLPPRLRIEGAIDGSTRRFFCMVDGAGVVWTNASKTGESETLMRRVTWRESLNLVKLHVAEPAFDRVIAAASSVQPHLIEMMRKYGEFASDMVVGRYLVR